MQNRRHVIIVVILLIINISGCGSPTTSYVKPSRQELKTIRSLAVTVEGHPEFSHIGAITNESSTLIMLFTGPAVIMDAAIRNNIDEKTAGAIKPEEILAKANQDFINTLVATLQQSERFDEVKSVDRHSDIFDAVLDIEIINWGSRIKHSESDVIIPFMDVNISMTLQYDNKLIWKEIQTVTYDTNHSLDDYKQQRGLFGSDFAKLINKAGKQIVALLLGFNAKQFHGHSLTGS